MSCHDKVCGLNFRNADSHRKLCKIKEFSLPKSTVRHSMSTFCLLLTGCLKFRLILMIMFHIQQNGVAMFVDGQPCLGGGVVSPTSGKGMFSLLF